MLYRWKSKNHEHQPTPTVKGLCNARLTLASRMDYLIMLFLTLNRDGRMDWPQRR